ncbi:MAG: hypothetical protein CR982_03645 [Candidatus Cloacimonadota bacterium]|nr:MAG: hypothetical protein CR982_03645 [Candidatus Cloacimonadota bacterium]PIE78882.1 MAG: hypothetical protein CSA15_05520 [Candidatus Delongbacteria bacterium]
MITINDYVISEKEFDFAMLDFKNQHRTQKLNQQQVQFIADQLIDAKLLLDESKRSNIVVDEKEIDVTVENIKKQMGSEEVLNQYLQNNGIDMDSFREKLRGNMALTKYIQTNFINQINVSDEDAEKYYNENRAKFVVEKQVKAQHILFSPEHEAKAKEVKVKIESGEDFAKLAKEFSSCPSGQNGGDLGFFGKGQMVKEFEDAAFSAEVNKVVGPVKTQFGYHLINVSDKVENKEYSLDEVRENLKKDMKNSIANHHIKKKVDELRSQNKISIDMNLLKEKS